MIFRAIRKVPPDVLRLIFLMLADAAPAEAAVIPSSCSTLSIEEFMPRRVAQVSRSWRHVAVECLNLWTTILLSNRNGDFNEDFKDFTAMLRKSCLLALQIHRTSGISLDVHIESFSPLCPLIRLLLPTSSHWRSLSLNIGFDMATYTILSPIEIFKLTVIECSCSSPSIVSSQLFLEKITQSSPRLDSVEGVFESLRACNFSLKGLHPFLFGAAARPAAGLISILEASPSLIVLVLDLQHREAEFAHELISRPMLGASLKFLGLWEGIGRRNLFPSVTSALTSTNVTGGPRRDLLTEARPGLRIVTGPFFF
ncbi:hypothetical protein C8J56DRAFT_956659 [Mycena floridula]|nr:hypothetical protein C8J56DRAFT_956659 [Mycena floridula]